MALCRCAQIRCVNSQAHKCKLQNGQMNAAGRALALRQCLFSRSQLHAAKSRSTCGLQQRPQLCRAASSGGGGDDGGGKQELAPPDVRELARMALVGLTDEEVRLQAAEWTDKSMDSTWAKRFRKSAVAGQYFAGKDGRMYEFGDRCASRKSKFVLAVVTAGGR